MTDLWEWQDLDAGRLRREGKGELAGCWERFDLLAESAAALRDAADLARRLEEPWWELFFRHWYVQQSLFRSDGTVQDLRPQADRLRELAGASGCAGCPQRFCAQESACNVDAAVDAPGTAEAQLAAAERLMRRVDSAVECRDCFELLRAEALIGLGRVGEASVSLDAFLALTDSSNHRCVALLARARAASLCGDLDAMAQAISECERLLDREPDVNPDNRWGVLAAAVAHRVLAGDVEAARGLLTVASSAPPEGTTEAIDISLALARGEAARAGWGPALRDAGDAARSALRRGMVRRAAEALLVAVEACRQLGDLEAAQGHASTLETCLGQLASRDLDARARSLLGSLTPPGTDPASKEPS